MRFYSRIKRKTIPIERKLIKRWILSWCYRVPDWLYAHCSHYTLVSKCLKLFFTVLSIVQRLAGTLTGVTKSHLREIANSFAHSAEYSRIEDTQLSRIRPKSKRYCVIHHYYYYWCESIRNFRSRHCAWHRTKEQKNNVWSHLSKNWFMYHVLVYRAYGRKLCVCVCVGTERDELGRR